MTSGANLGCAKLNTQEQPGRSIFHQLTIGVRI